MNYLFLREDKCFAFGSAARAFEELLREQRETTGKENPVKLLQGMIASNSRSDIGGDIQLAIATRDLVWIPNIVRMCELNEYGVRPAKVTFLGRDVQGFGPMNRFTFGSMFFLDALDT